MSKCKNCQTEPKTLLWCQQCQALVCHSCTKSHENHTIRFICQQCENPPEQKSNTQFCQNCEQHLCQSCSEKIHNKGKRAKHLRNSTTSQTLKLKHLYFIFADSTQFYGYVSYESLLLEFRDAIVMQEKSLLLIEKKAQKKGAETLNIEKLSNKYGACKQFVADKQFDEQYMQSLKNHYPSLQTIYFVDSYEAQKHTEQAKTVNNGIEVKVVTMGQQVQTNNNLSLSSISIHSSTKNRSNISAKYPRDLRQNNSVNISTSTDNSLRKRRKKSPIPYYHPYICNRNDKRSHVEQAYREMAVNGTLMIKKQNCKDFEPGILRHFTRNIGETQIQYVSLEIQNVSIECLYWVIRSIEEDLMAPTQKLVISRLKQSFDIKINSKFWHYIVKYLTSQQYLHDKKEIDLIGQIPRLVVFPSSAEDNYLIYCEKDDATHAKWVYEDIGKLNEQQTAWKQFLELITQYFTYNTQIGGGRYGCVQYIKFNSKKPLRDCSLGKLSLFVQQAINKGIIRYYKTVLVTNETQNSFLHKKSIQNEFKSMKQQQQIKISTLQLFLLDNFRDYGPNVQISLAQIPQNLRKNCPFDINYVQLGFPKLKNLLMTLTEFIDVELTKSYIKFQTLPQTFIKIQQKRDYLRQETQSFLQKILSTMLDIVQTSNLTGMAMEELYNQLNIKLNFTFDFLIFNCPDFYNFLIYYAPHYFEVQINMGYCIVISRRSSRQKKSTSSSTPKFNDSSKISFQNFSQYNWQDNILQEINPKKQEKEEEEENQSESYTDYKSIYNLIDDQNSQSKPKTVIVKDCSSNNIKNALFLSKGTPISQDDGSYYSGFEDVIDELEEKRIKTKAQHNRMYSTNTQPKTQHFRVYSNISRD